MFLGPGISRFGYWTATLFLRGESVLMGCSLICLWFCSHPREMMTKCKRTPALGVPLSRRNGSWWLTCLERGEPSVKDTSFYAAQNPWQETELSILKKKRGEKSYIFSPVPKGFESSVSYNISRNWEPCALTTSPGRLTYAWRQCKITGS